MTSPPTERHANRPGPTLRARRSAVRRSPELPRGPDAWVDRATGWGKNHAGAWRRLLHEANRIDARASEWEHLSDRRLREHLREYGTVFRRRRRNDCREILGDTLAALREASARTMGLRPFPVQLAGVLALHRGYLAEMATGEGKTLVAGIAAVLAAWTRLPCHMSRSTTTWHDATPNG